MIDKCPGQDRRNVKIQALLCPDCGYEVEIFSDEIGVRCPQCRGLVCRQKLPGCVDWCKSAKECIGEERYRQLKNGG